MAPTPLGSTSKSGLIKSIVNRVKHTSPAPLHSLRTGAEGTEAEVLLSNLPPTVLLIDLLDRFEEFEPRRIFPISDGSGQPTGCASLYLQKSKAALLIQRCSGMIIEGKVIKFALIDTAKRLNKSLIGDDSRKFSGNKVHSGTLRKPVKNVAPAKTVQKLFGGNADQDVLDSSFNNLML